MSSRDSDFRVPTVLFTMYATQIKSDVADSYRVVDKTQSDTLIPALREMLGMSLSQTAEVRTQRDH
jgi:hypothetical protein